RILRKAEPEPPAKGQGGATYATIPGMPQLAGWAASKVNNKVQAARAYPARTGFVQTNQGDMWWLERPVTDTEVDVLTRYEFTDGKYGKRGKTLMDRISVRVKEYGDADGWKNFPEVYERRAIEITWAEYEELLNQVFEPGVLPRPVKAAIRKLPQPVQDALEAAATVLRRVIGVLDFGQRYRRERALYSHFKGVPYAMTQWLGNPVQAALGGRLDVIAEMFNPKTIAA